jgi:hypothetical protein
MRMWGGFELYLYAAIFGSLASIASVAKLVADRLTRTTAQVVDPRRPGELAEVNGDMTRRVESAPCAPPCLEAAAISEAV